MCHLVNTTYLKIDFGAVAGIYQARADRLKSGHVWENVARYLGEARLVVPFTPSTQNGMIIPIIPPSSTLHNSITALHDDVEPSRCAETEALRGKILNVMASVQQQFAAGSS